MKYLSLLLVLFFVQCSQQTTENSTMGATSNSTEAQSDNFKGTIEERLAQMLRKESGVIVSQSNGTYAVKIRGLANSFGTATSPLFVINGTSIGHNFQNAAGAIAGSEIRSVRVLKGKDASFYGTRGSAGVVEINTKTPTFKEK